MDRQTLENIAYGRLYPSMCDPNFLVLRSRRQILGRHFRELPAGLVVLDVGGRYQPYRPLLDGRIRKYIALDLQETEFVDVLASGEQIPFRDATFDLVIATCVFEYFEQPHQAAKEIYRVMKPGGSLVASFPSVVPRFGDEDRWRYMSTGLRSLFSGFSKVEITAEVSSLGGFCRLVNLGLHDFAAFPVLRKVYEFTFCPLLNLTGLLLERAQLTANERWTGNYSLIAMK